MPRKRKTDGDTKTPDDVEDRRSIKVPEDMWKHVREWAKLHDTSEAAIVRWCIRNAVAQRGMIDALVAYTDEFMNRARRTNGILSRAADAIAIPEASDSLRSQILQVKAELNFASAILNSLDQTRLEYKKTLDEARRVSQKPT